MSKPETRGERSGFVRRVHATPVRRFVDGARKKIEQIAYDWDDLDYSVVRECDQLMMALDEFEREVKASIERMNEPADQE